MSIAAPPEPGSVRARLRAQHLSARLISGVLLGGLSLGACYLGGWVFDGFLVAGLLLAVGELLILGSRAGYRITLMAGLVAGSLILLMGMTHQFEHAGVALLSVALWMAAASLRSPVEGRLPGLAFTVFTVAYVAGLGVHLAWLRELESGFALVLLVLVAVWGADTAAFFFGVRFGRRKLAPAISPGKSVEGLFAGLVASTLGVPLAAHWLVPELHPVLGATAGFLIGVSATLGDLFESLVKRNLDAKDASQVIPGHGGMLDRIDSLLFAAPVAFYLFRELMP